ncbi:TVP38/TMEM64 family protein [Edwardsiella tarda]|uniref:TVP38/TMEM64 family protein n=1 Tax=Edwardsiella tarda TaxID=636 RepID=UPI00351C17FF
MSNGMKGRVIVLALVAALLLGSGIALRQPLAQIWQLLASLDIDALLNYLRSFGPWAMLVSFLLMIFQALAAPLPAFVITLANAALFGWWQGALLSWFSATVAAAICFTLARLVGRDALARWIAPQTLRRCDRFFQRYGRYTVLICRLLPFVSFDAVSYAAGLTAMSFVEFLLATAIGQLPATLIYSYVGAMLSGSLQMIICGLLVLSAISIMIYAIKHKPTAND